MHGFLEALPAILVLITGIGDLIRRAAKSAAASKSATLPAPSATARQVKKVQPAQLATGYAGRQNQSRLPGHARAMDSAGSRLAAGEEYPAIVAERIADRIQEASFASKVAILERNETSGVMTVEGRQSSTQTSSIAALQKRISDNAGDSAPIIFAIVFSEIMTTPRYRRNKQR